MNSFKLRKQRTGTLERAEIVDVLRTQGLLGVYEAPTAEFVADVEQALEEQMIWEAGRYKEVLTNAYETFYQTPMQLRILMQVLPQLLGELNSLEACKATRTGKGA